MEVTTEKSRLLNRIGRLLFNFEFEVDKAIELFAGGVFIKFLV